MNGNEGELEKRIRKQFLSNRWSQPSDIKPILDETKADILGSIIFDEDSNGKPFDIFNAMEIYGKLVKWFGRAEK